MERPEIRVESMRHWFTDAELQECAACGTQSLVTTQDGDTYCFACGHLPDSDAPATRDTAAGHAS